MFHVDAQDISSSRIVRLQDPMRVLQTRAVKFEGMLRDAVGYGKVVVMTTPWRRGASRGRKQGLANRDSRREPRLFGNDEHAPYVEIIHIGAARTVELTDESPVEAYAAELDIGDSLPIAALVAEIEGELLRAGLLLEVETRVRRFHVGASGIGVDVLFIVLGGATGIAFQEAWLKIRERFANHAHSSIGAREGDHVEEARHAAARILRRRGDDLSVIDVAVTDTATTVTLEVRATGERYEVMRSGSDFFMSRVRTDGG